MKTGFTTFTKKTSEEANKYLLLLEVVTRRYNGGNNIMKQFNILV